MKKKKGSYSVYLSGELFSLRDLISHAWLAEAIYEKSHGRFRCILSQDSTELKGRSGRSSRDHSLRALVAADLALFCFDGPDLASGTVVEFMYSKCADIPAVLLRTDSRHGSDQRHERWSQMANHFPRTAAVIAPAVTEYRGTLERRRRIDPAVHLAGQHSSASVQRVCDGIAAQCVRALERVLAVPPIMPKHLREEVYQWLARFPGIRGNQKALRKEFETHLEQKVERDLL